jgi:fluoroquinolone transport system permease protein
VRLIPIGLVAALGAPIFALILGALAENKVQGFAIMKGLGIFFLGPFVAWFVPEPWQYLLGVFPTYWPVKSFWLLLDDGPWLAVALIGMLYSAVWIGLLLRRFETRI